jgi:hypothetical protein
MSQKSQSETQASRSLHLLGVVPEQEISPGSTEEETTKCGIKDLLIEFELALCERRKARTWLCRATEDTSCLLDGPQYLGHGAGDSSFVTTSNDIGPRAQWLLFTPTTGFSCTCLLATSNPKSFGEENSGQHGSSRTTSTQFNQQSTVGSLWASVPHL